MLIIKIVVLTYPLEKANLQMGLLNKTKAYLVGPMENLDGTTWRAYVESMLSAIEVHCFNPYNKPFINNIEEGQEVRNKIRNEINRGNLEYSYSVGKTIRSHDLNLVDRSDFIIVNLHPTIASIGSVEELVTAVRAKKAIYIAIEGGRTKCPAWITWMVNPDYIYNSVSEIVEVLYDIDKGIAIDDRLKLLKPEYR